MKAQHRTIKALIINIFLNSFILVLLSACHETTLPKPKAYPRIALPEKGYQVFDTNFPYSFEYPVYSKLDFPTETNDETYWLNIMFPMFNGQIYLSYKSINNNLSEYTEDTRKFVLKHIPKASNIDETFYSDTNDNIYGILYNIGGTGAASTFQFYVTDSSQHFVRGALYFNMTPNNDSLAPVIDFLKQDIHHLIETMKWK